MITWSVSTLFATAVTHFGSLGICVRHFQPRRDNRLMHQFETQTLQMREMNQELADVKQTLAHTQKGKLIIVEHVPVKSTNCYQLQCTLN